ncbi:hypothetical protein ASO20_00685 [Mycoplasma sp. (ex Biomphalaria glabrata)]|uniref:phosphate acyltransferase PlsX n=1 Tax=Mycoplasma sp. (ex Biomphalaria glabrata) TaxID=1749074 RepID=UPI00073A55E1|nr:phosphate acyltransferase PlsX [Mycoplasma sp. (ex Biomphalaria glabrata)]ALV23192.1 hypothetical protein ASO20_00685 [Mycoplasma sp. (ex Biomphalaria glabrata)]
MHKIIAVDITGADNGPAEILKVVKKFAQKNSNFHFILVGNKEDFENYEPLKNMSIELVAFRISHADTPLAFRKKQDNPISKIIELLETKKANIAISAGNSGVLLANTFLKLKRLNTEYIPGFMAFFPPFEKNDNPKLVLDVGANLTVKPEGLVGFARMATSFYQHYYGVSRPTVGLLSNGTEKWKGLEHIQLAHELLEKDKKIHFYGNVESKDLVNLPVDILVGDGWTSNIALKSMEGALKYLGQSIKLSIKENNLKTKIGGLLVKKTLTNVANKFDHRKAGGALIIGFDSLIIKAHGSSDEISFEAVFEQAKNILDKEILKKLKKDIL